MKWFRRALIAIVIVIVLFWLFEPSRGGPAISSGSVLVLELSGPYVEEADPPLLARLLGDAPVPFVSLLSELKKAARDDRLAAVVLRIRSLGLGWGQAQELRDTIETVSAAGRRTIAYLEVPSLSGNLEYYVASAADEVHVSPANSGALIGLAAEYMFLGGLWENLGVGFEVERSGRYKTAAETLTGESMSEAYREVANALLDSLNAQFVAGIAEGRGVSEELVARAIDTAPSTAEQLTALGLADGGGFFDELVDAQDAPVVKAEDYARVEPSEVGFAPVAHVALVYGSGNVVMGKASRTTTGGPVLASDTVSRALQDAAKDPQIAAIVLRIDSPGGSAVASDIVWRALRVAKREGKPLVVSISNVAASGGYYVACAADAVFAQPGSITGSIGVFVLRPILKDMLEKLDIGVEAMTRGAHADILLATQPLSEGSRARLREQVATTYGLFLDRVADGRQMPRERVDELGQGRVWTGAEALESGLIDGLGGLTEAVLRVKQSLDIDADADVALVPYPPAGSLAAQLRETLERVSVRVAPGVSLPGVAGLVHDWLEAAPIHVPALVPPFVVDIR